MLLKLAARKIEKWKLRSLVLNLNLEVPSNKREKETMKTLDGFNHSKHLSTCMNLFVNLFIQSFQTYSMSIILYVRHCEWCRENRTCPGHKAAYSVTEKSVRMK